MLFWVSALGSLSSIYHAAATAKSLQLCPTLCDPIDGSPPGSCQPASSIIDSQFITVLELNLDVFRKGKMYFSFFCSMKKERDVYSILSGKKKKEKNK